MGSCRTVSIRHSHKDTNIHNTHTKGNTHTETQKYIRHIPTHTHKAALTQRNTHIHKTHTYAHTYTHIHTQSYIQNNIDIHLFKTSYFLKRITMFWNCFEEIIIIRKCISGSFNRNNG